MEHGSVLEFRNPRAVAQIASRLIKLVI